MQSKHIIRIFCITKKAWSGPSTREFISFLFCSTERGVARGEQRFLWLCSSDAYLFLYFRIVICYEIVLLALTILFLLSLLMVLYGYQLCDKSYYFNHFISSYMIIHIVITVIITILCIINICVPSHSHYT